MEFHIGYQPAHSLCRVLLQPGESVIAEAGAMIGMSPNVQIQTQSGGFMKGLKRLFGGESFFRNTFTSHGGPGEVLFAQALCGDQAVLELTEHGYMIQSSSFIASSPNVNVETKVKGFVKRFFAGEGAFVLKATTDRPGEKVLIGAFGGIQQLQCNGDLVIDTGHLVAWDSTLEFNVGKSGSGWIASFLSGEGLVCHFKGQGRIWIQSRNPVEYGRTVGAMLAPRG